MILQHLHPLYPTFCLSPEHKLSAAFVSRIMRVQVSEMHGSRARDRNKLAVRQNNCHRGAELDAGPLLADFQWSNPPPSFPGRSLPAGTMASRFAGAPRAGTSSSNHRARSDVGSGAIQ